MVVFRDRPEGDFGRGRVDIKAGIPFDSYLFASQYEAHLESWRATFSQWVKE